MERPSSHVLEEESRRAFVDFLPPAWTWEKKDPDYGLDMEVVIFENGKKTNKALWFQLKATESIRRSNRVIPFSIKTKYLKHFEGCHLPVIILLWIKPENSFYYIFAQRYIGEQLSAENQEWRSQKTVTIKFALQSKLEKVETLESIATEGYLYIIQQQLYAKAQGRTTYWLDGIPKSDDKELKERTIKALQYMRDEKYNDAIEELEDTLRTCTVSPTERMSILLSLGTAYHLVGQSQRALKNYRAILKLALSVKEEEASFGISAALGNIGIVYSDGGDLANALKNFQDALKIDREIGYRQGEANQLGNIGLVYRARGDLANALKYHQDALKIDREIGYRQGEANQLCNIGIVYSDRGDLANALKNFQDALKIHREVGYKQGEANDSGNIGIVYKNGGDLANALKYYQDSLQIHREVGYKQGEANQLGNIGIVYSAKGDLANALKYLQDALKIHREVGYKQGEANQLGNIGIVYSAKGDLANALGFLEAALKILDTTGLTYGREEILRAINSIKNK